MSNSGMLFAHRHSVATNFARDNQGVSRFAIRNDSAGSGIGFPHGLEFQIIGSASGRKVLIHLTAIGTNRDGFQAHFNSQVIVNVREG